MQERVVESKIDGDSLESLSTEKINNGQASVGAQYVHTYGIQYAAFHGIMAYLSVVLVLRLFYFMYVRTYVCNYVRLLCCDYPCFLALSRSVPFIQLTYR